MFIDRQPELQFLNSLLDRRHPGPGQLILLYGRRRIGKTALLRHWASGTGLPYTYWSAQKESAALQRRSLFARVLGSEDLQASFDSWSRCWGEIARSLADHRHILILDEFSYTANDLDSEMLSALQHTWDHQLQGSQLIVALVGSHVHAMEQVLTHQSPLFGRFTGQWCLRPLPYASLQEFFPRWSVQERIAAYAIWGGVPAYWTWLDPDLDLMANIRHMLTPSSPFVAEPAFLLYDELREPMTYLSIIRALGAGQHTMTDLGNATMISSSNLPFYLARLQELRLVERRVPITTHPSRRHTSKKGAYHLVDPFFRFYFRFIAPYQDEIEYQPDLIMAKIDGGLRAFIGATAFEELCRQWVMEQSRAGQLPLTVRECGAHWSRPAQADVVGINWEERGVVIGECKWGLDSVKVQVLRHLVEHTAPQVMKVLPALGKGWRAHYILFARAGFTPATRAEAKSLNVQLVDAKQLDADLRQGLESRTTG